LEARLARWNWGGGFMLAQEQMGSQEVAIKFLPVDLGVEADVEFAKKKKKQLIKERRRSRSPSY